MSEIKDYDAAAHKFHSSLKINSLPIISWDMYAPYYDDLCKKYYDITILHRLSKVNQWSYIETFTEELLNKKHVIVVTDPDLNIIHATQNILGMNGYKPNEIVGKKPNMFQGVNTCKETSKVIRMAVENKQQFEATILNYRKDGSTYKCWIKGEPIFNKLGEVVNFIAYEKEVA